MFLEWFSQSINDNSTIINVLTLKIDKGNVLKTFLPLFFVPAPRKLMQLLWFIGSLWRKYFKYEWEFSCPLQFIIYRFIRQKSKKIFHMFISMNLISFNFKKEKWREAFNVKVPSLSERPNMIQRFFEVFALSVWGDQEHDSFEVVLRMPHVRQWNAPPPPPNTYFQIVN